MATTSEEMIKEQAKRTHDFMEKIGLGPRRKLGEFDEDFKHRMKEYLEKIK